MRLPLSVTVPEKCWEKHFGTLIHVIFVLIAFLLFAVPMRGSNHDEYLYEKVHEQEKHLDNTDVNLDKVREMSEENREELSNYKYYFLGASGALGLLQLLGLIKQFNRGKESNG